MQTNRHDRRASAVLERRDAGGEPSFREVSEAVSGVAKTFAEFRAANDERLKQIETRGTADPATEEKVAKLNAEVERLSAHLRDVETRAARQGGVGDRGTRPEVAEHRAAWVNWARTGEGTERSLNALATRANTTLVPADGGVLVPEIVDSTILSMLRNETAVRSLFSQISVSSQTYTKMVSLHGLASGWVGETDTRPALAGPTWTEVAAVMGEIYANPQVSQTLLDDAAVDLETEMAKEIAYEFSLREGIAFLAGSGVKMPKGLFTYPTALTGDATRVFGTFQHHVTGIAATLMTATPGDKLIAMIYSLKSGYRQNASWLLNSATMAIVRTWKDGQGNYLWQPTTTMGEPATLLGYPVNDVEDMPDVAANAFPIAFGDFKRAYTVVDRFGIRSLRDPYTNKPYVGFYCTKRVGGMALDTQAVKFLKVSV